MNIISQPSHSKKMVKKKRQKKTLLCQKFVTLTHTCHVIRSTLTFTNCYTLYVPDLNIKFEHFHWWCNNQTAQMKPKGWLTKGLDFPSHFHVFPVKMCSDKRKCSVWCSKNIDFIRTDSVTVCWAIIPAGCLARGLLYAQPNGWNFINLNHC